MQKIKTLLLSVLKQRQLLVIPLLALLWNGFVYALGRLLAKGEPHIDMTLPIDRAVPLVPWTILIYWGCFLFWVAVYLRMAAQDRKELTHFFLMHFIGETICFLFFIFLPTANVRPSVTGTDLWSWLVRLQYHLDEANNLFPSIHCMISWFCWIGLRKQKHCPFRLKLCAFVFALAVFLSTLTLKQHVVLDVLGAVLTAEVSSLLAKIPLLQDLYLRLTEALLRIRIRRITFEELIQ